MKKIFFVLLLFLSSCLTTSSNKKWICYVDNNLFLSKDCIKIKDKELENDCKEYKIVRIINENKIYFYKKD